MYWMDELPEQTIGQALRQGMSHFADRTAYSFDGRLKSLREVGRESECVARALLQIGVKRGDRVAIWMANHPEWPSIYFGLLRIGASLVAMNMRWKASELQFCLEGSDACVLFVRSGKSEHGRDYGDILREVLPELEEDAGAPKSYARAPALRHIIDLAERPMPGTEPYGAFLDRAGRVPLADLAAAEAKVQPRDEAMVQYTSGTTSFPKGARLHHAGILRGARETLSWLQIRESDVFFSVQPYYHSGGSIPQILGPVITGCRVTTQEYFCVGEALELMEREGATALVGHQPHFVEYMNHPSFATRVLKVERILVIAPSEIFWMVKDRFGTDRLVSAYGMTETHMLGTATSLLEDSVEVRFNTNGRPVEGVRVEIRDPDGNVLEQGEEGEIFLGCPYPMLGYLDEPQATADVLQGDWYRTGDKGVIREDGNLILLGRVRDMIRVGGENLAGAEVEACLLAHPAVKQAAVIAVPDPRLGEVVAGFLELKPGAIAQPEDIIAHCRERLASYKVPRFLQFVTEWPMSGSGKIQKRLLELKNAQPPAAGQEKVRV